jgi:hypothetical protein
MGLDRGRQLGRERAVGLRLQRLPGPTPLKPGVRLGHVSAGQHDLKLQHRLRARRQPGGDLDAHRLSRTRLNRLVADPDGLGGAGHHHGCGRQHRQQTNQDSSAEA